MAIIDKQYLYYNCSIITLHNYVIATKLDGAPLRVILTFNIYVMIRLFIKTLYKECNDSRKQPRS